MTTGGHQAGITERDTLRRQTVTPGEMDKVTGSLRSHHRRQTEAGRDGQGHRHTGEPLGDKEQRRGKQPRSWRQTGPREDKMSHLETAQVTERQTESRDPNCLTRRLTASGGRNPIAKETNCIAMRLTATGGDERCRWGTQLSGEAKTSHRTGPARTRRPDLSHPARLGQTSVTGVTSRLGPAKGHVAPIGGL